MLEILSAPPLPTVKKELKLKPEDVPSPPDIAACQPFPTGVCTVVDVLVLHPLSRSAASSRIATSFMIFLESGFRFQNL